MKLMVNAAVPARTIELLRQDGLKSRESVVLWLGRRRAQEVTIVEVLRPDHRSGQDFFHIPPASMTALQERLRNENLMIGAQVHTHPMAAFHSPADDRWAIIRHVGALSLVVPYFAQRARLDSFWSDTAVFAMTVKGRWALTDPARHLEVLP